MIYTHNVAADIVDEFEQLLEENEIMIPDEARTDDESEACLYGDTYSALLDAVEEHLLKMLKGTDCKVTPYVFK